MISHIGVKNYLKLHLNYHIHENQDGTNEDFETLQNFFDESARKRDCEKYKQFLI